MSTDHVSDPDLAEFDEVFASAESSERGEIPDGDYTAVIEKLEKRPNQRTGAPQVSWWLTIDGPKYAGRRLFRDTDIKAETMAIIKSDLRAVGFDIAAFKMSEFSARAPEAVGKRVNVTKKKNANGYAKVYINGLALDAIDSSVPF